MKIEKDIAIYLSQSEYDGIEVIKKGSEIIYKIDISRDKPVRKYVESGKTLKWIKSKLDLSQTQLNRILIRLWGKTTISQIRYDIVKERVMFDLSRMIWENNRASTICKKLKLTRHMLNKIIKTEWNTTLVELQQKESLLAQSKKMIMDGSTKKYIVNTLGIKLSTLNRVLRGAYGKSSLKHIRSVIAI
jgi:hypothetical protein